MCYRSRLLGDDVAEWQQWMGPCRIPFAPSLLISYQDDYYSTTCYAYRVDRPLCSYQDDHNHMLLLTLALAGPGCERIIEFYDAYSLDDWW